MKQSLINFIVFLCKLFFNKKQKIVYHSFPDFSDNSFATFIYISNNFKSYSNVWLVNDYSHVDRYKVLTSNYTNNHNYKIVKKKSLLGMYHYLTANVVFYTHGIFNFFGLISGQKKINLWHGMPIKNVGLLNNTEVPISDFYVATSPFYQDILSKAFGVSKNKVLIGGQTRNDFLIEGTVSINQLFDIEGSFKQTILWMPTYRKSIIPDMKNIDGSLNPTVDFLNNENLLRINEMLVKTESFCFLKIHPMDVLKIEDFGSYSNLKFLDNTSFDEKGMTMYSIFNSVDILLTDFSSIYIDFLLLNKPIGFVFSDFGEFENSRGFIFSNPIEYMPGQIITNLNEMEDFLCATILDNQDEYEKKREVTKNLFHVYVKDFSKQLLEKVLN